MCARFFLDEDQEELLEIVAEMQRSSLSGRFLEAGHEVETSGEIRPTQVVPVIAPGKSRRKTGRACKGRQKAFDLGKRLTLMDI